MTEKFENETASNPPSFLNEEEIMTNKNNENCTDAVKESTHGTSNTIDDSQKEKQIATMSRSDDDLNRNNPDITPTTTTSEKKMDDKAPGKPHHIERKDSLSQSQRKSRNKRQSQHPRTPPRTPGVPSSQQSTPRRSKDSPSSRNNTTPGSAERSRNRRRSNRSNEDIHDRLSSNRSGTNRSTEKSERLQERMKSLQFNHRQGQTTEDSISSKDVELKAEENRKGQRLPSTIRRQVSSERSNLTGERVKRVSKDDALMMEMIQKVQQIGVDKSRSNTNKKEHGSERAKIPDQGVEKNKAQGPSAEGETSVTHSISNYEATQQQRRLEKALSKIAQLEAKQERYDDLETKYQDAQLAIANLQLQGGGSSHRNSRTIEDTLQSGSSHSTAFSENLEEREDRRPSNDGRSQAGDETRKAESPPSKDENREYSHIRSESTESTGTIPSTLDAIMGPTVEVQSRNDKLQKLKDFRRSRESQLKELVLESQNSPTDVQCVIRNLQDELKAAKEVIEQQKKLISITDASSESATIDLEADTINLTNTSEEAVSKRAHLALLSKYTNLQIERAWGEFQLRDRITNDALKFHRRLRHWKEQAQETQSQLESIMEDQAKETKELRLALSEEQQATVDAEQDLIEYKRGMEATLQEFGATKDRLANAMKALAKYEGDGRSERELVSNGASTTDCESSSVHSSEQRSSWSTSWFGKSRQRGGDDTTIDMEVTG